MVVPAPAPKTSFIRDPEAAGASPGLFAPPAPSPPAANPVLFAPPAHAPPAANPGLFAAPAPSPPAVTTHNQNNPSASGSHVVSTTDFNQELFKQELVQFYEAHGPSKVPKIDYFLKQYTHSEIRNGILAKYGMSLRTVFPGLGQACECLVISGQGIPCIGRYRFDKLTAGAYPRYTSPDSSYTLYNKGDRWLVTQSTGTSSLCMSADTKSAHSSRLPQHVPQWVSTGRDIKIACEKCGARPASGIVQPAVNVLETPAPTVHPTSAPSEAPYCPCLTLDIQGRGDASSCHGSFKYTGQQLGGHPVYMRVRPKQDYVLYFVEAEGRWVVSEKVGADSFCIVAAMLASLPDRVTKWMDDLGEIVGASMYCDLKCATVSFEREPPRFRLADAMAGGG